MTLSTITLFHRIRHLRRASRRLIVGGACCLLLAACGDQKDSASNDSWNDLPTLDIVRPEPSPSPAEAATDAGAEDDPNGMTTIVLSIPPTFVVSGGGGEDPADPFAADSPPMDRQLPSAQEILERAGVEFGDGAFARYDRTTNLLTVYNTKEQLELVDAYTESIGQGPMPLLTCRVEIFEMPTAAALNLQRSAGAKTFHDAERRAVVDACRRGDAAFVTGVDLPSMSGQRSRSDSTSDYLVAGDYEKSDTTPGPVPQFEWRQSGLRLEIDPVVGANETHIDLNLSIEQALAEPGVETTTTLSSDGLEQVPLQVPIFSESKITTQVTLVTGTSKLISAFPVPRPREATESSGDTASQGRSRLIFVQAWVRRR